MKSGDRITWKKKRGEYIGRIRHTRKHRGKDLAMVQFDGNARVSRVPIDEITAEQKRVLDECACGHPKSPESPCCAECIQEKKDALASNAVR